MLGMPIMNDNNGPKRQVAGKGRPKGRGYAMGNKRQITVMITDPLLDETDEEARFCGESRATVINRAIREHLARMKAERMK